MLRCFIGSDLDRQGVLLPLQVRDVLPADHLAWEILDLVEELDLDRFLARYRADGVGRPPYHPRLILALIMYCYRKRQSSLREMVRACRDDLGARVIMGGAVPGIATLSEFMGTHREAIRQLLPATLAMGEVQGLVDVSVVAGDGTKLAADAAMTATTDEAGVRAQIADLEAQIEVTAAAWAEQVAAATTADHTAVPGPLGLFDPDPDLDLDLDPYVDPGLDLDVAGAGGGDAAVWRRLGRLNRLLHARRAALAYLLEHPPLTALGDWQERMARDNERVALCQERLGALRARLDQDWQERQRELAAGVKFPGRPMRPVQGHSHLKREQQALDKATARAAATTAAKPVAAKVNTTDPASRIMPGKHEGFDQRYNMQALACKNQFILAITLHDSPNDKQALRPLLTAGRANLDAAGIPREIEVGLFDAGYASEANITDPDLPAHKILIAVEKEGRQTGRRRDGVSTAATAWQSMADLLADPANTALYKRRAAIVEPVFAQLFQVFGRQLHTRGDNVLTELHLWAVTHNLAKIARARQRQRQRPAA